MRNKTWFIIGALILILLLGISGLGFYLSKKTEKKEEKPKIVSAPELDISPLPIKEEEKILPTLPSLEKKETRTEELVTTSTPTGEEVKTLFDKEFGFGGLIYPYLYIYDRDEGILKYLNLEDKTYKELYKGFYLKNISVSPTRKRIVFQENNKWKIIDLGFDTTKELKFDIQSHFWVNDTLYFFSFVDFKGGGLYKFSDFQKEPELVKPLDLIDGKIKFFNNLVLVYVSPLINSKSYVFSFNLKKPSDWQIYLEEKDFYSLLPSSNGKYLYLSYLEDGEWISKIIDQNKKEIKRFDWASFEEKCTFEEILVCGVPLNKLNYLDDWFKLKRNFNDKIVIFNPQTNEQKEIKLNGFYDILKPQKTPLGIIFFNRNDSKFYIVNFK